MVRKFFAVLFVISILHSSAFAYIDPFLNPIKLNEIAEWKKRLEEKKKADKNVVIKKPEIFKLKSPPFEKLIFQGVIGNGGSLKAVAVDPQTGKVYIFSPGDPVDVNAKILKIEPTKLVLKIYKKVGGRLVADIVTVNFNMGEVK